MRERQVKTKERNKVKKGIKGSFYIEDEESIMVSVGQERTMVSVGQERTMVSVGRGEHKGVSRTGEHQATVGPKIALCIALADR